MIRYGKISEVDASKGRARVNFEEDEIVSDWLPISMPTTLGNRFEFWPDVNMFVWCIMDENSEDGVIGGALYDDDNTPPVGDEDKSVITFKDGTTVTYDRSSSELTIECVGDIIIKCVNATIEASGGVTVDTPQATFTGSIEANGDITAGATTFPISLLTHKHTSSTGPTGTPIP